MGTEMNDRRTRFREYMARLDVASDPASVIEGGMYVRSQQPSVGELLAARGEIEPFSGQLLLGGIGSGKTTELRIAEKRLRAFEDILPIYVDVSTHHDLAKVEPQILAIVAGLELSGRLEDEEKQDCIRSVDWFTREANGRYEYPDQGGYDDGYWVPGVLITPDDIPPHLKDLRDRLRDLVTPLVARGQHPILLLDSLDRMTDFDAFLELVKVDIPVLKSAGIGVILVGPLSTLFQGHKEVLDAFDEVHYQYARDVRQPEGREFLFNVLRARADADILPDVSAWKLIDWSGGVLRDLISLAHAAGTNAYIMGSDSIDEVHVNRAADAFGRKHMLGMTKDQLATLQRVRTQSAYIPTSDQDLELLILRRIIKYSDGNANSYALHPTLTPLLEQLAT